MGALTSKVYELRSRPWECKSVESVDILDSMLSNIRVDIVGEEVYRIMPIYMNDSIWITNKVRYMYDSVKRNRLLRPKMIKNGKIYSRSWYKVFLSIILKLEEYSKSMSIIASNLEDYESLNLSKEYKNLLGIKEKSKVLNRKNYLLKDLKKYKSIVVLGINMRLELPLMYYKIRKVIKELKINCLMFGIKTSNYKIKELGNIDLGNSTLNFCNLISGKLAESSILLKSKNWCILYDKSNLDSYLSYIEKKIGCDLIRVSLFSGEINKLELGINEVENKKRNILLSMGVAEIKSKSDFVIYKGHHIGSILSEADMILPSSIFIEDSGSYIDIEGTVKRTKKVLKSVKSIRRTSDILLGLIMFSSYLKKKVYFEELRGNLDVDIEIMEKDEKVIKLPNVNMLDKVNNFYKMDVVSSGSYILETLKKSLKMEYWNNSIC